MVTARFAISVPIGTWHPLLAECLASLIAQGDILEIAVLDASGDPRVAALLDSLEAHFAFRRTGPDDGQSDAIIEGWRNTHAPILGWLNADDVLYPGALAAAAKIFDAEPATDLVYGDSTIVSDDGAYVGYHWAVAPPDEAILSGCTISQPSCFFKRDVINGVGGLDPALHYTMDWDLWVRLWRAGVKFVHAGDVWSRVLWSDEAKTGGFNAQRRKELERIIGENNGVMTKMKSRIGFALHHVLEYQAPAPLARAWRRRKAGTGRIINGFDRAGGLREGAIFPLVCWSETSPAGIEIEFTPDSAGRITVNGQRTAYKGGVNRVPLDAPPACGDIVNLIIDPSGESTFLSARWA